MMSIAFGEEAVAVRRRKMQVWKKQKLAHRPAHMHAPVRVSGAPAAHENIHTHTHAHMHSCIHTYIHEHTHACMHACIHTYIHMHTYMHALLPMAVAAKVVVASSAAEGGMVSRHFRAAQVAVARLGFAEDCPDEAVMVFAARKLLVKPHAPLLERAEP